MHIPEISHGRDSILNSQIDGVLTISSNQPPKKQPPLPQTSLTLFFKQHRTTIALLCPPTASFSNIRSDLLSALTSIHPEGLNDTPLPTSGEDIILGVPLDKNDFTKGWTNLEIPEFDEEELAKAKGAKGVRKGSVINQTPLGAGLKDGGALAFRFRREGEGDGEDEMDIDSEDWDVVLASLEDEGGSQSQR